MNKKPAIYILTNKCRGTLYTGVTSDLVGRIWQHKNKQVDGFSKRYGLNQLVYFEMAETMLAAIEREKQIKVGSRVKKIALIENANPEWKDLYPDLLG